MNTFSIPGAPTWFNLLLNLSLQAAFLAMLIWIVLKVFGRWIPPAWRALIWSLVILRVLLPFSPPSPFSLQNLFVTPNPPARPQINVEPPPTLPTIQITHTVASNVFYNPFIHTLPIEQPPAQSAPQPIGKPLALGWTAGAAFFIIILAARSLFIRRRLLRDGIPASSSIMEVVRAASHSLRLRWPLRVTVSNHIASPALTGFIPARLIIPTNFNTREFTPAQMLHIIRHELAHIQQGHLFLHWLALIARALHWFNPAIHLAASKLRQECELAADAAALKNCGPEERAAYGETIFQVLAQSSAPPTLLALGMAEEARHLQQRLRVLATPPKRTFHILGLAALATLIAAGMTSAVQLQNVAPTLETLPEPREVQSLFDRQDQQTIGNKNGVASDRLDTLRNERLRNSTLIEDARLLIELGRLAEAEKLLKRSLEEDPENRPAHYYLQLIHANSRTIVGDYRPGPADIEVMNEKMGIPSRKSIQRKLETLRISDFPLNKETDLVDLLKELGTEIRKRDPGGRGLNIIIFQPRADATNTAPTDVERFRIKFNLPIGDVTLGELFDAIVKNAKPPPGAPPTVRLKYSVNIYGVVFSLDSPEADPKPSASVEPASPDSPAHSATSKLVQDARSLIEQGRLDDAQKLLIQAVNTDPEHRPAFYYLSLIKEMRYVQDVRKKIAVKDRLADIEKSWNGPLGRELLPTPNPITRTNIVHASPARKTLYRKLETIRIDDFPLEQETELADVLKRLGDEIRKRDPDGRGVNLIISKTRERTPNDPASIDPLTGLPPEPQFADPDPAQFKIKFDPPIRDVTLGQFLDAIVMVAQPPAQPPPSTARLRYSVEDYAIVFSVIQKEQVAMYSRTFRLNPNTFRQGFEAVTDFPNTGNAPQAANSGRTFVTTVTNLSPAQIQLRTFLAAAGVDFPTNNVAVGNGAVPAGFGAPQQKAIFLNERTGVLKVRATLHDLDIIENALHVLNTKPVPKVKLDVRVFEVNAKALPEVLFPIIPNPPFAGQAFTNQAAFVVKADAIPTMLEAANENPGVRSITNVSTVGEWNKQMRIGDDANWPEIGDSGFVMDVTPTLNEKGEINLSPLVTTTERLASEPNALPRFRVRQMVFTLEKLPTGSSQLICVPKRATKQVLVGTDLAVVGRLFELNEPRTWLILITPSMENSP